MGSPSNVARQMANAPLTPSPKSADSAAQPANRFTRLFGSPLFKADAKQAFSPYKEGGGGQIKRASVLLEYLIDGEPSGLMFTGSSIVQEFQGDSAESKFDLVFRTPSSSRWSGKVLQPDTPDASDAWLEFQGMILSAWKLWRKDQVASGKVKGGAAIVQNRTEIAPDERAALGL